MVGGKMKFSDYKNRIDINGEKAAVYENDILIQTYNTVTEVSHWTDSNNDPWIQIEYYFDDIDYTEDYEGNQEYFHFENKTIDIYDADKYKLRLVGKELVYWNDYNTEVKND